MCLAIPSKIVSVDGNVGVIDLEGVTRNVNLSLLAEATVGSYVLVHAGFAINIIDESEAVQTLDYLKEAAALLDEEDLVSLTAPP